MLFVLCSNLRQFLLTTYVYIFTLIQPTLNPTPEPSPAPTDKPTPEVRIDCDEIRMSMVYMLRSNLFCSSSADYISTN